MKTNGYGPAYGCNTLEKSINMTIIYSVLYLIMIVKTVHVLCFIYLNIHSGFYIPVSLS